MKKIIVIGGGAAGLMAAITAAVNGAEVTLLEKNEKIGKKLYITGKGRCNLTNACPASDFFSNVSTNEKFLFSAIRSFDSFALYDWFESAGLKLKTERGNRVFPLSDKSSDVIKTLQKECNRAGVKIMLQTRVTEIRSLPEPDAEEKEMPLFKDTFGEDAIGGFQVLCERNNPKGQCAPESNRLLLIADAVIVATGGISYQSTGATGDGYVFAQHFGHTLVDPIPSLVPIRLKEPYVAKLEGLSLRNVFVKIAKTADEKPVFEEFGEMVFTADGVSGPVILTASSRVGRLLLEKPFEHTAELNRKKTSAYDDNNSGSEKTVKNNEVVPYKLFIDLKPALSEKQLDQRILRDFEDNKNKEFKNSLQKLLPAKLIPVIIKLSGIEPDKRVNLITKTERAHLLEQFKGLNFTIGGLDGFEHAVITKGGVDVKKISPKTMESKLVPNLYFAGEVLDVDAVTGGFNLQIAFATGRAAGLSATNG